MKTERCQHCLRDFSEHLMNDMALGPSLRYVRACPICALRIRNELHGLPADTPFEGPRAKALYVEALAEVGG